MNLKMTKDRQSLNHLYVFHDPKLQELLIHWIKLENISVFEGMGASVTVNILPLRQIQHSNLGIAPDIQILELLQTLNLKRISYFQLKRSI